MARKKYKKRQQHIVLGVQINLDIGGFTYFKWGGQQSCKKGDWLVNNNGDCYTISEESFSKTYREIAPGQFVKVAPVWAVQAKIDGKVETNEGFTDYVVGDYIVSNTIDGSDSYAVSKSKFEEMYEEF